MTGVWIVTGVIGLAVLLGAFKTGRPLRALTASAMQGIAALAAVNVAGAWTGVSLGVTGFSVGVCTVLGLPGTVALLVIQAML